MNADEPTVPGYAWPAQIPETVPGEGPVFLQ